jgi:hypothetical protein
VCTRTSSNRDLFSQRPFEARKYAETGRL